MTSPVTAQPNAILAFNKMAEDYDDHFTKSLIGRANAMQCGAFLRRPSIPATAYWKLIVALAKTHFFCHATISL